VCCRSDSDSDNEGDPEKKKLQDKLSGIITPTPVGGRGIVFGRFLSLFLCFFVSNITRKRMDQFA